MRHFFVCPNTRCSARVEYEKSLLDEKFQCKCNEVWTFNDERILSEMDYNKLKNQRDTVLNIELNHHIQCPKCSGLMEYQLNYINKTISCPDCDEAFKCTSKNVTV